MTPVGRPREESGLFAREILGRAEVVGQVAFRTRNTVYLVTRAGELIWLTDPGGIRHRRGVWGPAICPEIKTGDFFFREGQHLRLGRALFGPLPEHTWIPAEPCRANAVLLNEAKQRASSLLKWLGEHREGGAEGLFRSLAARQGNQSLPQDNHYDWQARSKAAILNLGERCFSSSWEAIFPGGREQVGLGEGATPAGDDFLGGFLFAAHWLPQVYPELTRLSAAQVRELVNWASGKTTLLSHALLADAAEGHGPEYLHELFCLLTTEPRKDEEIWQASDKLMEMGQSTGIYYLAGLLTAFLSAPSADS